MGNFKYQDINLDNTESSELSVLIKLPEGDDCKSDANKRYQITQVITCDEQVEVLAFGGSAGDFSDDQCEYTIKMKSKHGNIN